MDVADRVEKRRFVGREFLLWLWLESELFDGTLSTRKHGSFGLTIERALALSVGVEGTRIKGGTPARHREAKEALARGKLPEAAGIHVSWGDREIAFTLKAERLALSALSLPTVLGDEADEAPTERRAPRKKKGRPGKGERDDGASDEAHEAFYERMRLTQEVEGLVEALYADFLVLRLGAAWEGVVVPTLRAWMSGEASGAGDPDRYRKKRDAALAAGGRRRSAAR